MNAKKIILVLACGIALSAVLSPPARACILIVEVITDINEVEVTEVTITCQDSAAASVACPGFTCARSMVNGCPSRVDCDAPRNPDGTRNAKASAYGNGWIPRRWTAWAVLSGSGCTADAQASAQKTVTVKNITQTTITVTWLIVWIPWHPFYWVAAFDEGAYGVVEIHHIIEDITHEQTLIDSITTFNPDSPDQVMDSTGLLMWERFMFYDEPEDKFYHNAFRPMEHEHPIVLNQYQARLEPDESMEVDFLMTTRSCLLPNGYPKSGIPPIVGNPKILSKTVGIGQCAETIAGDLNEDCMVNFQDVAILANNWLVEGQLW